MHPEILSITLFGIVAAFTPGPNNFVAFYSGFNFGIVRTLPHIIGVTFGFPFLLLCLALGLINIFKLYPLIQELLKYLGTLFLIYLAYKISFSGPSSQENRNKNPIKFHETFIFQFLNPKGVIASIILVSTYIDPGETFVSYTTQILVMALLVSVTSITLWTFLGKFFRKFATNQKFINYFNYAMSLLLLTSIITFYLYFMTPGNKNSYNSLKKISINNKEYNYYSLSEAEKNGLQEINKLPKSLKVLLENLLRYEDDLSVTKSQIEAIKNWLETKKSKTEIAYRPARVLLQDYTGIPAVADLAAMREAVKEKNKDPNTINPLSAVDLVIDHSVQVDQSAKSDSFEKNVDIEFERNGERYSFLKWGQQAFNNFRIVPPGTGICHQVNLEYLSKVVWSEEFKGENYIFPDTLVGTDSHTTMVNGLSVLGWGVGGIEAEAGMLGQPISMLIPEVIGFEVTNKMPEGTTATDLVLTVVKMLRDKGVVGKFVEFYGSGLKNLTLADRATIANMAPEYGATCGFFPIDDETLKYLKFSGRDQHTVDVVEHYAKEQGLWASEDIEFTDKLTLDMSTVVPTISE